jgi:Domain of unknown function (DUF5666)
LTIAGPKFCIATMLALVVSGCGGGGGQTAGGIGGTGSSLGPVSGFGSIIVNGVEFATDNASISIEGETQAAKGDLSKVKLGQIVLVRGTYSSATTGTANNVIYFDNLEGPVTEKNSVDNSFRTMGQTVLIDSDPVIGTKFANAAGMADLNVNDIVEVSGSADGSGNIVASYIEKKGTFTNGSTEVEIKGNVGALDLAATTFKIGPLTIDYDANGATTFKHLILGDLTQAPYVEVKGTTFDQSGAFIATSIERIDRPINPGAKRPLEIAGVTANCAAPCGEFTIEGQSVITNEETIFRNGDATDLLDNRKIEAEGTINSVGKMVARKVTFVKGSVQIEGLTDLPADVSAQTLSIIGITAKISSVTKFKDNIALANISAGTPLKILGYRIGDDTIIVTQIESSSGATRLQGPLHTADKAGSIFTILNVAVAVDRGTIFKNIDEQAIGFDTFFDTTASSSIIGVKGIENPDNRIDATAAQRGEVEIQD